MGRPNLPKADDLANIAKALRDEGFARVSMHASPDGSYVIAWGEGGEPLQFSEFDAWKARRDAS